MSTTKKAGSDGFSEAERAAMRERAQELKAQGKGGQKKADNERAVLDAIAAMPDEDRQLAERIHALVTTKAPDLLAKTWYGMPAYANGTARSSASSRARPSSTPATRHSDSTTRRISMMGPCGRSRLRSSSGPRPSRRRSSA